MARAVTANKVAKKSTPSAIDLWAADLHRQYHDGVHRDLTMDPELYGGQWGIRVEYTYNTKQGAAETLTGSWRLTHSGVQTEAGVRAVIAKVESL